MTSTTPTAIRPPAPLELVSFHPAPARPPSDDVATIVPPASGFVYERTANENLAALGLTKRLLSGYRYEYLRGSEVVHVGNVYTVSEWMAAGCPEVES
jgi:hypothetical protein